MVRSVEEQDGVYCLGLDWRLLNAHSRQRYQNNTSPRTRLALLGNFLAEAIEKEAHGKVKKRVLDKGGTMNLYISSTETKDQRIVIEYPLFPNVHMQVTENDSTYYTDFERLHIKDSEGYSRDEVVRMLEGISIPHPKNQEKQVPLCRRLG